MKKIMITFREGGENGGPFVSHQRIMKSSLKNKYEFIPLYIPKGRLGVLNIKVILKLIKKINEAKPDLIHFTGLQLEGFHVMLACKILKIKTILAIHGSSLEALSFSKIKKDILNILEILTLKNVSGAYGVSEYVSSWTRVKRYCKNYYGHIYNLPNKEYSTKENKNNIRKELGILEDEIVVVSTGRITKEKGYKILEESIKNIKVDEKVAFVIVGDGEYKNEMEQNLQEHCSEKKIYFLGYRNDVEKILNESDIFVIATLHETLCNSIIEAGNQRLAIVATNVGGIPEIIDNEINGYLVEINNSIQLKEALEKLIVNKELRSKFSQLIKKKIDEKFQENKILDKIDSMYWSLLSEKNKI